VISKTNILGGNADGGGVVGVVDGVEVDEVTLTGTDCVALPALLLAVNVYVVLELGDTDVVPAAANPLPTPWSICTLVALVTFQIIVVDSPSVISVSLAENATMVGTAEVVVVPVDVGQQAIGLSARTLIRISSPENKNSFFISTS